MAIKTMITAHTGANKTSHNGKSFFGAMKEVRVEGIEADLRLYKGKEVLLGHTVIPILKSKRISLEWVLDYCEINGFILNCDIKESRAIKPTCDIIRKKEAQKFVYLTGCIRSSDIDVIKGIPIYCNEDFYVPNCGKLRVDNLENIKKYLEGLGKENIKGINIHKRHATETFLEKAKAIGLGLSVYTVSDYETIAKLLFHEVDNITTLNPNLAREIRKTMSLE